VYPGGADVLNGIVPAGVPGHVADPCGPSCSSDPASSKVLIQQLFNGAGIPPVNIDYYQGPEEEAVAGAIEASLAAVGIPTVKRPKPAAEYDQFATSGQAQLFRLGAVGVYASAEAYLAPLFFSGSRDNATGFTNADFDSLVAQAQATADPAARLKLEQQAEQTLMALVPIMPIAQFRTTAIVSSRVHDLELSVLGTFACERVWIDT
jgi:ABC-type transport system substrate-binding protein